MDLLQSILTAIVIVAVAVAAGLIAKSYFQEKQARKKQMEILTSKAKNVENSFREQFLAGKPDKVKEYLGKNFSLFIRNSPYRIDGTKEAMKWYEQAMAETQTLSVHNLNVTLLDEKVALVTYNFTGRHTRAEKPFEGSGKTTRIWQRNKNDGWVLAHEHTSFNMTS